jgi:hypothetical protein
VTEFKAANGSSVTDAMIDEWCDALDLLAEAMLAE